VFLRAADGTSLGTVQGDEDAITAAVFTPDSKRLLTGSANGKVSLWDVPTRQRVGKPWSCQELVHYLALSPDGSQAIVATKASSHLLRLDGALSENLWSFTRGGTFLPDGKTAAIGQPFAADIWNLRQGAKTDRSFPHTSSVSAVAVDAAGKRIATGAWAVGQVWDLRTGNPIGPPLRHKDRFKSMTFTPDGRLVASLAFNGEARFWDAETGRAVGPVLKLPGPGNAMVLHPDGSTLLATSSDALVHRWRVPRPVTEKPELLMLRAQVLTGMELDVEGVVRTLAPDVWRQRRQHLEELAPGTVRYLDPK
jgi:WD40 repeat protein